MSMSLYDSQEMLDEMGFCSNCGDHKPCGCEPVEDYDLEPINEVLTNAISKLNALLPNKVCPVCGVENTAQELHLNNDKCYNCNTSLKEEE